MSELVDRARAMAYLAHEGQKYGNKDYFIGHIVPVVSKAVELFGEDDYMEALAFLHDVVEDTGYSVCDIQNEFGIPIARFCTLITYYQSDRTEYLKKCMSEPVVLKVKIADTIVNLEESIKTLDKRRIKKYRTQLIVLLNGLVEENKV